MQALPNLAKSMRRCLILILLTAGLSSSAYAQTKVLFEGYYKMISGGVPIGYLIRQYKTNKEEKTITCTYFYRTNELGGNLQESLKAVSKQDFTPVSYQYTRKDKSGVKVIDASFKNGQMSAKVSDGKNVKPVTQKIPDNAFLSSFLSYRLLKEGYKVENKAIEYKAVAEEDPSVNSGRVQIQKEVKYKGQDAFRMINQFKKAQYVSIVTKHGQVLKTKAPKLQLTVELVSSPAEATQGFQVGEKSLRQLFGQVPRGQKNILAKSGSGGLSSSSDTEQITPSQNSKKLKGDAGSDKTQSN